MSPDDNLPFMTWHARPDMSCEYVNPAWLEYTGYMPEQALGEGWSRCLHPEDLARWLDTCVRAFDERRPFDIEYRLRRHDGEYRWMLDRAAPRYGADGAFVGYRGSCVDIDAHKREQHALARSLEREHRLRVSIEESSRARHGLTVSVLQELQPPAQAIATWAGHLRAQVPPASEAAEAVEAIERHARAQASMISNLLRQTHPLLLGVRVLVVDPAGEDTVKVLEVAGADVRVAATTAEALRTLGSWQPDVILSDSDGCLRAAARNDGARVAAAGYDARLVKPVEPVALLATVARLAA
jgi:PAS domain S-box-containing protein